MVTAQRTRFAIILFAGLVVAGIYVAFETRSTPVDLVSYWEERVRAEPRLYPAYTQLSLAYLERARTTHQPQWLQPARDAANQSLALQDNFEALVAMAQIESYAHRFRRALRWGRRAAAASSGGVHAPDPEVIALLVAAELALGHADAAANLLPGYTASFHGIAARAQWLAAVEQVDAAAAAFVEAADLARAAGRSDLEVWARARAAGVYIGSGRAADAEPLLASAEALDEPTPFVRVHRAEICEATDQLAEALEIYEAVIEETSDPAVAVRAHAVALRIGNDDDAGRYFAIAEAGLRSAIDAGEVFTLEPLARLYLDAGAHLDRAEELARNNLRWKRDPAAHELLREIRARTGANK